MGDKALAKGVGVFDFAWRRVPMRWRLPGRRTRRVTAALLLVVVLLNQVTPGAWHSRSARGSSGPGEICAEHEPGSRGDAATASLRARLIAVLEERSRDVDGASEASNPTAPTNNSPQRLDDTKFTVVLNTFQRRDLLKKAVAHYARCGDVAEIRVVWSEQVPAPTENDADARLYFPNPTAKRSDRPKIKYDPHPTTSIQNRFDVKGVTTTAVFNIDDDVRMPCASLAAGFRAWRRNRNVLVGYFPRLHVWRKEMCQHQYVWDTFSMWRHGEMSIVLTKAAFMKSEYLRLYTERLPDDARKYVDARKNCEDVAMQLLVTAVSREPPVWVKQPTWHFVYAKLINIGVAGISKGANHHDLRGKCVTDLSRILLNGQDADEDGNVGGEKFGDTPLIASRLKPWRDKKY